MQGAGDKVIIRSLESRGKIVNKKKLAAREKQLRCYWVSNLSVLFGLYGLYIYIVFTKLHILLIKLGLVFIGFFAIGYLEEYILSIIVNAIVSFLTSKKWKQEIEEEYTRRQEQARAERIAEIRAQQEVCRRKKREKRLANKNKKEMKKISIDS